MRLHEDTLPFLQAKYRNGEEIVSDTVEAELGLLQLNDIRDYTLKDFQDVCIDFNRDTGLELQGTFGYCRRCGKMHLFLHVDWPEKEEEDEIYVQ